MSHRILRCVVAASALLAAVPSSRAAAFTPGSVVVVRLGSGVDSGPGGYPVELEEYTWNGAFAVYQQTVSIPATTMQLNLYSLEEGFLHRSADGYSLTLVGYTPPPGGFTGSRALGGRSTAQAPRSLLSIGPRGPASSAPAS